MRRTFVRTAVAFASVLAASSAAAQGIQAPQMVPPLSAAHASGDDEQAGRPSRWHLLVGVGGMGGNEVGSFDRDANFSDWARLNNGTTASVAAEWRTPVRGVDLRAGLSYARPGMSVYTPEGVRRESRTNVTTLGVDAVVRGPRILDARPYVLGGVAVRRIDFDQAKLEDAGETRFPEDRTGPVARFGAGVAWNVGRYELFVEGVQNLGWFDRQPGDRFTSTLETTERSFTAGIRVPLF